MHVYRGASALVVLLFSIAGCATTTTAAQDKPQQSLYQRLGGYDAIAAVTDDFIGRLTTEPQFTRFFAGFSTDSKKRIRQLIVDQLCEATGGPCIYTGRSMKVVHGGLGITQRDWDATVKLLVASLDKFKVPQREKDELLTAVSQLKPDIVEK
jgi:hemoglobin